MIIKIEKGFNIGFKEEGEEEGMVVGKIWWTTASEKHPYPKAEKNQEVLVKQRNKYVRPKNGPVWMTKRQALELAKYVAKVSGKKVEVVSY